MQVFHNKLRYIVWRGDEETGGLIGCPVEPRGFMLAMVAVRSRRLGCIRRLTRRRAIHRRISKRPG